MNKKLYLGLSFSLIAIIFASCGYNTPKITKTGTYYYIFNYHNPSVPPVKHPVTFEEEFFVIFFDSIKYTLHIDTATVSTEKEFDYLFGPSCYYNKRYYDQGLLPNILYKENDDFQKTYDYLTSPEYVYDVEPMLDGPLFALSNGFFYLVDERTDSVAFRKYCEKIGVTMYSYQQLEDYDFDTTIQFTGAITLSKESKFKNVIAAANDLYEKGFIKYYYLIRANYLKEYTGDIFWCSYPSKTSLSLTEQDKTWNTDASNAPLAWQITKGNPNITIAVIDKCFDIAHEKFVGCNLKTAYDADNDCIYNYDNVNPNFEDDEHGTHVAGIIFSKHDGTENYGVAPNISFLPIKIEQLGEHQNDFSHFIRAIEYAVNNGADVISISAYMPGEYSTTVVDSLNSALNRGRNGKGCIIVMCAGNDGESSCNYNTNMPLTFPQNAVPNLLTVASCERTTENNQIMYNIQSRSGNNIDITAPGENIYSTIPVREEHNNRYRRKSGTSMAAPHVAGVAALMLSVNPNLTRQQVCDIIEQTAVKIDSVNYPYTTDPSHPNGSWNQYLGYGLVDAYAAVKAARDSIFADLHIRDNEADSLGIEPSNSPVYWNSPDICILDKDSHSEIISVSSYPKDTCSVAVNIQNISSKPSGNLDERLYLTWKRTTLAAQTEPLRSKYESNFGRITPNQGEPIELLQPKERRVATRVFDFVKPNDSMIRVAIKRSFPSVYNNTEENLAHSLGWGFSIMAAANEGFGTLPEISPNHLTLPQSRLAKKYNSIAVSNTDRLVADKIYGQIIEVLPSANRGFTLSLTQISKNDQFLLTDFAEIYLLLSNDLASLMDNNSPDIVMVDSNRIVVKSNTLSLDFLPTEKCGDYFVGFEVHFYSDRLPELNEFDFDISMLTEGILDETMRYTAIRNSDTYFNAHITASKNRTIHLDDSITLTANTIQELATYEWYDANGDKIAVGQQLTVSPLKSTSYILKIEQTDNGYVAYDTIHVQVIGGSILSVSPNPATTQAHVSCWIAEQYKHAYINVTNLLGIPQFHIPLENVNEEGNGYAVIPLQTLPAGTYFLQLVAEGMIVDSETLIKN